MNDLIRFAPKGLAAAICLLAAAACDGDSSKATPRPGSEPPTGWRTYGNTKLRYSIAYPSGWTVDASYVYPERLNGKDLTGVSFTIPDRIRAGTNLAPDTRLSVESIPDAKQCEAGLFLDFASERARRE